MEIKQAKTAGFCFGVKRAVNKVYEHTNEENVYTFGPIIHNDEVVKDLENKGVKILNTIKDIENLKSKDATIIIRSHGVEKRIYDIIEEKKYKLIDATCPFVLKIHKIVKEQTENGVKVIIVGDKDHPEVQGIKGWCKTEPIIIKTVLEAQELDLNKTKTACIVSQTTFNYNKFQELVEIILKKGYDISVFNTICNATEERQNETMQIAKQVEAMVIIGGKHSSNTQKLYEISKKECENTYYIQTLMDLDLSKIKSFSSVGISAGASTPNNIIKEVHNKMAEESFEKLLEESLVTIRNGEVVEGTVIAVKEDEIVLNIGYKADGIITRNEYSKKPNLDLTQEVQIGDKLTAKVIKLNDGEGQVLLSCRKSPQPEKISDVVLKAFENKEVLTAKVNQILAGGISAEVDGTRVFIPASLVSDSYEKNLEKYADQEVQFVITECNPKKRRIIGDRKQLLIKEKEEKQKALFEKISVGMVTEGVVKNVTDFGAFIDLGGADGLLHISEMSWGRVENPKKVFKVGDKVKVLIKNIDGNKIALSLKFEDTNPWANAEEKYVIGNVVTGKVARMADFGAFIELEPGVDALLHVSQISKERIEKPSSVLTLGQEITAKIVDFKLDEKKISLSMKALENNNVESEKVTEE